MYVYASQCRFVYYNRVNNVARLTATFAFKLEDCPKRRRIAFSSNKRNIQRIFNNPFKFKYIRSMCWLKSKFSNVVIKTVRWRRDADLTSRRREDANWILNSTIDMTEFLEKKHDTRQIICSPNSFLTKKFLRIY